MHIQGRQQAYKMACTASLSQKSSKRDSMNKQRPNILVFVIRQVQKETVLDIDF